MVVGGYGGVDGHGTGGVWSCVWEHLEWFGIWEGGRALIPNFHLERGNIRFGTDLEPSLSASMAR